VHAKRSEEAKAEAMRLGGARVAGPRKAVC
jgi:hypothetical protein